MPMMIDASGEGVYVGTRPRRQKGSGYRLLPSEDRVIVAGMMADLARKGLSVRSIAQLVGVGLATVSERVNAIDPGAFEAGRRAREARRA